ncbi:hypothetical protein LCGC14_2030050 [marine sediment metagenome]|uniref:EamA domain-containing protein n=1 Tax=marine sediment metagenome TaxID=412755 RepID=A0A0F9FHI8_9ZZZZ
MNPTVLVLVLCSTFMHAGWNLLARRQRNEMAFFGRMLLVCVVVGLLPAGISELLTRSISPRAWACVLGSGALCGAYYFCLGRAYESSDFTVVYPVARALPVLLVGAGDVLLGRHPTSVGWLGMVLVVGGCLLTPLRSFKGFALRRYLNRTSVWILLTAMGTVGYTLLDKLAAEAVKAGPATAARYGYVFFVVSYLSYTLLVHGFLRPRPQPRRTGWLAPAVGVAMNFGAYWLILWAYQMASRASYVVAFRQFSIVIGVVLAFAIYKEPGKAVRLTGTGLILAGLVVIGLWGR